VVKVRSLSWVRPVSPRSPRAVRRKRVFGGSGLDVSRTRLLIGAGTDGFPEGAAALADVVRGSGGSTFPASESARRTESVTARWVARDRSCSCAGVSARTSGTGTLSSPASANDSRVIGWPGSSGRSKVTRRVMESLAETEAMRGAMVSRGARSSSTGAVSGTVTVSVSNASLRSSARLPLASATARTR